MRDSDLLKKLLKDGWQEVSIKGSHHKLKKGNQSEIHPNSRERCSYRIIKSNHETDGATISRSACQRRRLYVIRVSSYCA